MRPLASSTTKVSGKGLLARMSNPNWQKISAGLARRTTGPTWIAWTSTSLTFSLAREASEDDFLGERPLGVSDLLLGLLDQLQALLDALRPGDAPLDVERLGSGIHRQSVPRAMPTRTLTASAPTRPPTISPHRSWPGAHRG